MRDGSGLFDLGFVHVTMGNHDRGLALMEKGLRKGRVAGRPQIARLRLGIAYLMAGRKADVILVLKSSDAPVRGTADVAVAGDWRETLPRVAEALRSRV